MLGVTITRVPRSISRRTYIRHTLWGVLWYSWRLNRKRSRPSTTAQLRTYLINGPIPNRNILNGRFVLALKNVDRMTPTPKLWFVTKGHTDRKNYSFAHSSSTARVASIFMLAAIAYISSFPIWSLDVT